MGKLLGEAIREHRKKLKLKVYELAKKVGVEPEFITQIEKGRRLPSEKILAKIEHVLKIDLKLNYLHDKHPDMGSYLKIRTVPKGTKVKDFEIIK